jgi:hypothetical protein
MTTNGPSDRGRPTILASNESIVREGIFVHGGVEGDVRIVHSPIYYGTGDYEDPPEIGNDFERDTYYLQYDSTTERGDLNIGRGGYPTLAEAIVAAESAPGIGAQREMDVIAISRRVTNMWAWFRKGWIVINAICLVLLLLEIKLNYGQLHVDTSPLFTVLWGTLFLSAGLDGISRGVIGNLPTMCKGQNPIWFLSSDHHDAVVATWRR